MAFVPDDDPRMIDASAEKRFFIEMLTKDIELLPAIADLVDNSVDGARAGTRALSEYRIEITASGDRFEIVDNAGGISADIARNYAFKFGRPSAFKGTPGSVGQFGIGMKRAIFKLGTHFRVESAFAAPTPGASSMFTVEEDVDSWEKTNDWTFRFSSLTESADLPDGRSSGTTITVTKLHPSIAEDLSDDATLAQLRLELATRHQRSIVNGLTIVVNGQPLGANQPVLQSSDTYSPVAEEFDVDTGNGTVHVRLVAGTIGPVDRTVDEGRAQNFQNPGAAGWYLYCNDRLLLAGDRSAITGWGGTAAAYHPQYRNFRGYVFLDAEDASLLPWNTTKTAVDRDHPVFRRVATEMKKALVEVQSIINRVKAETARWVDTNKDREERGETPLPATALLAAAESAPPVRLEAITTRSSATAPPSHVFPSKVKADPKIQRIQYVVDLDRYNRLAKVLNAVNGSDLGRITFDYVWDAEID
ncbi:ATP-binding protein [Amnibacterium endophyticum]|uniref:ATP-binding protein n=1 Tax=Amnibacterium endophyticum TaxID=2109337 RepID=A0ABW4LC60_9MICO